MSGMQNAEVTKSLGSRGGSEGPSPSMQAVLGDSNNA